MSLAPPGPPPPFALERPSTVRCHAANELSRNWPTEAGEPERFGGYVFTVTAPELFDADLITPFPLEAVSEEQSAID